MDSFNDPEVRDVVGVFGSQLGKTEAMNNVLGFFMVRDPCPILFVQPTLSLASSWSKLRLVPMIRDTPALRDAMGDPSAKTTGQEILEKSYPGGQLAVTGANSPGGLAGRPRRLILADEIDRFPLSAGSEGSPIDLAKKRTSTFWNRKHGWISSPGTAGESQIWPLWESSDQRRFWVPCPDCGQSQTLKWAGVRWEEGAAADSLALNARYGCEECGSEWDDASRMEAVAGGEWRKGRETGGTAGFHLNALYSPWMDLEDLVREWLEAQGHPESLKVFVNTRLAELWEEAVSDVDIDELLRRREPYGPEVPEGVLCISCGVDIQDDRVELEIVGWGRRGESWSLDYRVLYGDPEALLDFDVRDPDADKRLDDELSRVFDREGGGRMRISATCIDSGGHHTQSVYRYCKAREKRRVYAIKGKSGEGVPLWPVRSRRSSRKGVGRVGVHIIGVDTGKSQLFHRLAVKEPGKPGFCHFPDRPDVYDIEFFTQLTGEAPAPAKYVRGRRMSRLWKQIHPRVEALDCRNYASAALASLSPNWERIAEGLERARVNSEAVEGEMKPKRLEDPEPEAVEAAESSADPMERRLLRERRSRSRSRRGK